MFYDNCWLRMNTETARICSLPQWFIMIVKLQQAIERIILFV